MTCDHCALPLPPRPVEQDGRRFCCSACALVYGAIHAAGLQAYYERRDRPPEQPPAVDPAALDGYERAAAQAPYLGNDGAEAAFLLDGLHCAACAWLVEQALANLEGVRSARVNFAAARLRVRWDPSRAGLGQIVRRVAAVGYRATPCRADWMRARPASRDAVLRMVVAGAAAGNIMLIAAALYAGYFSGMEAPFRDFFHWVSLALALPVLLYSARPFFTGAGAALRHGTMTMDVPISLGAAATFGYSAWATAAGRPFVYFDTMAMLVFVLLLGRLLEGAARSRAAEAVERLLALGPRTAVRLEADGRRAEVGVEALVPGDRVEVVEGARVPADGDAVEGRCWVDESMLTGEAVPVEKTPGDPVSGGTVCVAGRLHLRLTRTGGATAVAQIARMVEEAQARRAPLQTLADRAAAWFVGATLGLAVLTFVIWLGAGVERALLVSVSVLVISCPCALGLATPLAVAVSGGRAARRGVLFRGGDALEALGGVTHVFLDKTGTVTEGRLRLHRVLAADGESPARALELAAALEQGLHHPLARALVQACPGASLPAARGVETAAGAGLSGVVAEDAVSLGTLSYLRGRGCEVGEPLRQEALGWESGGHTLVWMARGRRVSAVFALSDKVRAEAAEVVCELRARGLRVALLSGDRAAVTERVAAAAGIEEVHAQMLPADKLRLVEAVEAAGGRVCMVGDGVNDAPALAAATVGVAVGGGTEVSSAAADVVLLRPGLLPVLEAFQAARGMRRTVRGNLALSALYNLAAIPVAMAGWVAPVAAAVAMPLSSLLVVAWSLRAERRRADAPATRLRPNAPVVGALAGGAP